MRLDEIRTYYDKNTRLFLRFGSERSVQSIHRALWFPGVKTLSDALDGSNRLVLERAQALSAEIQPTRFQVADLGCGVGATLGFVLSGLDRPAFGVGLTISPVQASIAGRRLAGQGLHHPFSIMEADFQRLPLAGGFHLIWSIEAFIHALNPELYLAEVARLLVPGGQLILVDDFATSEASAAAQTWRSAYRQGWFAPNLLTPDALSELANVTGLLVLESQDLTPSLHLRVLPGWLGRALLSIGSMLPVRHPILPSMLGSLALQHCLHTGFITYRCLVLGRR